MTDVLVPDRMDCNERLQRLDAAIDWDRVDALLADVHASSEGRPAYPPLLMVKVMLLQQQHDASDTEMEDALYDRLSFRRSVVSSVSALRMGLRIIRRSAVSAPI